jgi:hypothetical protein
MQPFCFIFNKLHGLFTLYYKISFAQVWCDHLGLAVSMFKVGEAKVWVG